MGPYEFKYIAKLYFFFQIRVLEFFKFDNQLFGLANGGNFSRRWNDIVSGLAEVYMIQRMDKIVFAFFPAHHFVGAVGYYFICVHVHACASSALDNISYKLPLQTAVYDFVAA